MRLLVVSRSVEEGNHKTSRYDRRKRGKKKTKLEEYLIQIYKYSDIQVTIYSVTFLSLLPSVIYIYATINHRLLRRLYVAAHAWRSYILIIINVA